MRYSVRILLFLIFASPALGRAEEAKLPADLAAIPSDCVLFARINVAELWQHDTLKPIRSFLEKAGPKALTSYDNLFQLSNLIRMTVYCPKFELDEQEIIKHVTIYTMVKPIDRKAFLKRLGDRLTASKGKSGEYFVGTNGTLAVRFLDDATVAIGTRESIQQMADRPAATKPGPLTGAIRLAQGSRTLVFGFNPTAVSQEELEEGLLPIPENIRPLLRAEALVGSFDFEGNGHVHFSATYKDEITRVTAEESVKIAKSALKNLIDRMQKTWTEKAFGEDTAGMLEGLPEATLYLFGLSALGVAEESLKSLSIQKDGNSLSSSVEYPANSKLVFGSLFMSTSVAVAGINRLREFTDERNNTENLVKIGRALIKYGDHNKVFPTTAIYSKSGRQILSWRVDLLPFLGEKKLYEQFHLDEPWDSEHNKPLSEKMPKVFRLNGVVASPGYTNIRVFAGETTAFDPVQGHQFPAAFTDGLSNTLLCFDAAEPTIWTKPDEVVFDPKAKQRDLFRFTRKGAMIVTCDSSVHLLRKSISESTLRNLIQRNDGQPLGSDFD